ncbi:MAG: ABC transporter permease subunit [Bradyrhizobiaceae bacterium]|nr:ABC transporter permease subunit [Bradyrhizobiaceae bacterium]
MTAPSWSAPRNSLIVVALVLIAWQILFAAVGPQAMAPPLETIGYLAQLLTTEAFWGHVEETSRAFLLALLLAVILGLFIGFLLGAHRFSREVFESILVAFYSIPKITLYPIILLAFGLGLPAKIAFGTIHGIVPVAIFTMGAVSNINPILIKTARVLKLRPWKVVAAVLFPAALPEIFTGIRIGFALTLIGTLLGEMFGSQRGLGYLLMTAIGLQNVRLIMAVTLLIVLFAATVSTVLIVIDHRLHRRLA